MDKLSEILPTDTVAPVRSQPIVFPIGSTTQPYVYRPLASKKIAHDHDEEVSQERWLLSYADFITLLMVLFMMLYALQLVKAQDVIANSVRSTVENQTDNKSDSDIAAESISENEGLLLKKLAPLVAQGAIRLSKDRRGVEININAGILFKSAEAKLLPASKPMLAKIANALGDWKNNLILVEGHTDSLPISTEKFESNWELSSARAGTVVRYFVEQGIVPSRLSAMGRADNVPASLGETAADLAMNRRVTILVQY